MSSCLPSVWRFTMKESLPGYPHLGNWFHCQAGQAIRKFLLMHSWNLTSSTLRQLDVVLLSAEVIVLPSSVRQSLMYLKSTVMSLFCFLLCMRSSSSKCLCKTSFPGLQLSLLSSPWTHSSLSTSVLRIASRTGHSTEIWLSEWNRIICSCAQLCADMHILKSSSFSDIKTPYVGFLKLWLYTFGDSATKVGKKSNISCSEKHIIPNP